MSETWAKNDAMHWNNSTHMNPMQCNPSTWLFSQEESTLLILHKPNPTKIWLSQCILIFCTLLDLHNFYWSSDSPNVVKMEQHSQLTIYHTQLKSSVEADLLCQHRKDADAVKMPEVMGPWIQQTIMLYGHNDHGHNAFEKNKISVFPRTLEGMINSSFYWLSVLMIFLFEVILKALQLNNIQEHLGLLVKISCISPFTSRMFMGALMLS